MTTSDEPQVREDEPSDPSALLDVRGLTVRFKARGGDVTAVDDVSFTVRSGERVALVGESGSGKSGTCQAVAGLFTQPIATVVAQRLVFGDVDVLAGGSRRIPSRIPGMAMIFQDAATSLDPVWTVGSQLRNVIRATQRVDRSTASRQAEQWLGRVGLTDVWRILSSRPYELSGGMRQRAMIAIALSGRPRLLIADEPTSALDASLSREIMELLVGLTAESHTSLLLVSHDIHLCHEFADRMLVMYGGRIVEEGGCDELASQPRHPYTRALFRSVPTLDNAELDELPTIRTAPSGQRDPGGGCNFRPRCEQAHEACRQVPPRVPVGSRRSAACWLAAEPDGAAPGDRDGQLTDAQPPGSPVPVGSTGGV